MVCRFLCVDYPERATVPILYCDLLRSVHYSVFQSRRYEQKVRPDMVEFMAKLRERITVGVVGGSDLPKQKEQLGECGE